MVDRTHAHLCSECATVTPVLWQALAREATAQRAPKDMRCAILRLQIGVAPRILAPPGIVEQFAFLVLPA